MGKSFDFDWWEKENAAVAIVLMPRQCIAKNRISRQGGNLVTMQMTRPAILLFKITIGTIQNKNYIRCLPFELLN